MGMTWEQYWLGDVRTTNAFAEARKMELENQNALLWRQGMYFYEALSSIASALMTNRKKGQKPHEYPKEPYPLFTKEKTMEEKQEEKDADRLRAELYMRQMLRMGKGWGKGAQ